MRALVLGGSGAVGSAVVTELARDHEVVFTGTGGLQVDFRDAVAWEAALEGLADVQVLVHAAGIVSDDWEASFAVNVRAFEFAARLPALTDVVACMALAPGQALPLPPVFASTQGALGALVMALARARGPQTRVNGLALGPLGCGLSAQLSADLVQRYLEFSALRRHGTPVELARAIGWLVRHNTYVSGQILPLNGGL